MDLSKLQRVAGEKRDELPEARASQPAPTVPYARSAAGEELASAGADLWLSLIIGTILIYLGREFAGWAWAFVCGRNYDTGVEWRVGPQSGQMVPYWQISNHQALSDSAVFLFGLVMIAEAILLAIAAIRPSLRGTMSWVVLLASVLLIVYNVITMIVLFSDGVFPIVSLLAVGFGGYVAMSQWLVVRRLADVARP